MDEQPYRMTFGKHKNQPLSEVPPDYRSWLIAKEIYADKDDLRAALIQGKYVSPPATEPKSPPSTPTRKRKVSESETAVSPSSAKKIAISKEAKRNGTMLNYDGTAYILDFGKHAGRKLSDVPSTYISWLITTGVYEKRSDLTAALRKEGSLVNNCTPDIVDSTWRAPSAHNASDSHFYDPLTQSPLWISDVDASRYFRLGEPLLSNSGVYPVSEADLRRSAEFAELLTVSKVPKRWLYQVYACARRFSTVGGGTLVGGGARANTAQEALRDFLGKNRRREGEIWDAMGFGQADHCE